MHAFHIAPNEVLMVDCCMQKLRKLLLTLTQKQTLILITGEKENKTQLEHADKHTQTTRKHTQSP